MDENADEMPLGNRAIIAGETVARSGFANIAARVMQARHGRLG
jgi:hypothetical protein